MVENTTPVTPTTPIETPKQEAVQNTTPTPYPTDSILTKAEAIFNKIEKSNKKAEELVKRQEEIIAKMILGGRSNYSEAPKTQEQLAEDKIQDEVDKALKMFKR